MPILAYDEAKTFIKPASKWRQRSQRILTRSIYQQSRTHAPYVVPVIVEERRGALVPRRGRPLVKNNLRPGEQSVEQTRTCASQIKSNAPTRTHHEEAAFHDVQRPAVEALREVALAHLRPRRARVRSERGEFRLNRGGGVRAGVVADRGEPRLPAQIDQLRAAHALTRNTQRNKAAMPRFRSCVQLSAAERRAVDPVKRQLVEGPAAVHGHVPRGGVRHQLVVLAPRDARRAKDARIPSARSCARRRVKTHAYTHSAAAARTVPCTWGRCSARGAGRDVRPRPPARAPRGCRSCQRRARAGGASARRNCGP